MAADTVPARLFAQERHRPDAPAWCEKVDGAWRATRWADHARLVRRAARALAALGVEKGSAVAILGFNRPEWVVMDLAAMCLGAVPVGIYTTSSPDEVQYIAAHCDAAVILVESVAQWEKVNARRGDLPALKRVETAFVAVPSPDAALSLLSRMLESGADVIAFELIRKECMQVVERHGLRTRMPM